MPRFVPVSSNAAVISNAPDWIFHPGFWQNSFLKEYNEIDNQPPTPVTIISPSGGENIGSRYFTIVWSENPDPDGDCVSYDISYSTDDGASWLSAIDNFANPISDVHQGTTSIIWDLGAIPDSTMARIKICSTDSYGNIVTTSGSCLFVASCNTSNRFTISGGSCF